MRDPLSGRASVFVQMRPVEHIEVPRTESPPRVDGVLDDTCWAEAKSLPFLHFTHMAAPLTELFARQDSTHLYFAYRRSAAKRGSEPVPFTATRKGRDVQSWHDDGVEVFLTDTNRTTGLYFGVFAGDGTAEGKADLANRKNADLTWNGAWSHAVRHEKHHLLVEMAIPLATLRQAGINPRCLSLNANSRNKSGVGPAQISLTPRNARYFDGCRGFLPVADSASAGAGTSCTIRLHLTAPRKDGEGDDRALHVALPGHGIDQRIEVHAGGELVTELSNVVVDRELRVDIAPADSAGMAVLCGLEVLAGEE